MKNKNENKENKKQKDITLKKNSIENNNRKSKTLK